MGGLQSGEVQDFCLASAVAQMFVSDHVQLPHSQALTHPFHLLNENLAEFLQS